MKMNFKMGKKSFRPGGVRLADNKLSAHEPIIEVALPDRVVLTLGQHIGAPAEPVVSVGDMVVRGQKVGQAKGVISANVHTPISGTVIAVGAVRGAYGFDVPAVTIQASPDDHERDMAEMSAVRTPLDVSGLSAGDIRRMVAEAGIVGMGGATFPTGFKLDVPEGRVDTLVVNAVECEPFLTCDHALMMAHADEVVAGVRLSMRACGALRAIIGIEENKPDAIARMREAVGGCPDIEVVELAEKYPQGGEKQLIYAVTGREVPSGKLPADVGCVVQNVATAYAVWRAVAYGEPLMSRVVTVTGPEVRRPSNYRVAIGYPLKDLLGRSEAGCYGKAVMGGPMMGRAMECVDVPVEKGCSGVLLLPADMSRRGDVEPCVRCARCVDVCPMGLEPYLISTMSRLGRYDEARENALLNCIECGSCSYVCPSSRPLLDFIRYGKMMLRTKK